MFMGVVIKHLVAEWIHFTLFWDYITHYKTESVHFLGLVNPAAKKRALGSSVFFFGGGEVQSLCGSYGLAEIH